MKRSLGIVLASVVMTPVLSFCAHEANKDSSNYNPSPDSPHGVAQMTTDDYEYGLDHTTPQPFPLGLTKKVADVAVQPAVPAPIVKPAPLVRDRCAPTLLSTAAVGQPCLTTVEFIRSLGLGEKRTKRALSMVLKADKGLAH